MTASDFFGRRPRLTAANIVAATRGVAAVVSFMTLCSCELITSRDGLQCRTNADCQGKSGQFAQSICTNAGVCELVQIPEGGAVAGCVSSGDCAITAGGPARCVNQTCISLAPPNNLCTTAGPVSDDNAVLIAALVPQSGQAQAEVVGIAFNPIIVSSTSGSGDSLFANILDNWNQTVTERDGGASDASIALPPRFGIIACDESQLDSSLALFKSLKPQIILGTVSGAALSTVQTMFSTTPIFSPLGDDPAFSTKAGASNTNWFCSPNRASTLPAFTSSINLVSQFVLDQHTPGRGSGIKIALVYNSLEPEEADVVGTAGQASLLPFSWLDGGTSTNAADFEKFDIASTDSNAATMDNGGNEPRNLAREVAEFHADVVVITGPVLAVTAITQIDQRWSDYAPDYPLPTYLV